MKYRVEQTKHAVEQRFAGKLDVPRIYPALLGDGLGNVQVSGQPGYVYVRIGSDLTPGKAFNARVPLIEDLAVLVGHDAQLQPELFQVLALRQCYVGGGLTIGTIPQVGLHHETHEWMGSSGSDVVYVHLRQWMPLRVRTVSAFTVQVDRGIMYRGGWVEVSTQQLDLSGYQPRPGACYVLLYLDADGTLAATAGSTVTPAGDLDYSDIPEPAADEFPVAAVRLYGGQTAIHDTYSVRDIVDLRWPQASSTKVDQSDLNIGTDGELTISGGAVTRTRTYHAVDTEGDAASDYLDTIAGGSEGDVIVIHPANDDRDIVVRHDVGTIWMIAGENITLSGTGDHLMLVYDGSQWCSVGDGNDGGSGGSGSGTPVTLDADADTLLELTGQEIGLDTQAANTVFAGPTSGADATPTFRALDANDLPLYEDEIVVANAGAAYTVDWAAATLFQLTLTANCVISFSNVSAGRSVTLVLIQDGTGSRTVTWPGVVHWPNSEPTLSTTAGTMDIVTMFVLNDGATVEGLCATGGAGGHTIQDGGVDETDRAHLNFVDGEGVALSVTDDAGDDASDVTADLDVAGLTEETTIDGVNDGALIYDNSVSTHRKIPPWRFQASSRMIYAQTADTEVVDTTDEATLLGDGAGTLTIPANSLIAGSVIRITGRGQLSDTGTPTLNIKATLGGTTICETGATALTGVSAVEWQLDVQLTLRSIGAIATPIGGGLFDYDDGSEISLSSSGNPNVDTTADLDVGVTMTWGTANAANTITSRVFYIEILNPPPGSVSSGSAFRITEADDERITESSDSRVTED